MTQGVIGVDEDEWYLGFGYAELAYAMLLIGVLITLQRFRGSYFKSDMAASMVKERGVLLGLIVLALVVFVLSRVLGVLWELGPAVTYSY